MTDEQRQEAGIFYNAALEWLERLETGRTFDYFDPFLCWVALVAMTQSGMKWERGLLP